MNYEAMWNELHEHLLDEEENVKFNMSVIKKMRAISDASLEEMKTRFERKHMTASEMGKIGGRSTSDAKGRSSAANGKLGGRPKKVKGDSINKIL